MDPSLSELIKNLPTGPGVYIFKDNAEKILYVGKAKNVKKRVKSHFQRPEQHQWDFTPQVADIDFLEAANENEALLIESELIKNFQPKFNVAWKDDKDYFFVGATDEKFPRVCLTHQPDDTDWRFVAGPFMRGGELKGLLRELRKIFPYRTCKTVQKKPCMYQHLGLCFAPCVFTRSKAKYATMVASLFALLEVYREGNARIEGYDISNISGTLAVGSMVVFENRQKKKSDYRKFKIRTVAGQNDVGSLREVLLRRKKHSEWPNALLILLDGGKGQLKASRGLKMAPTVALAKIKRSSGKLFSPYASNFVMLDKLPEDMRNLLLRVRDEAHRFAITYHKQRRVKQLGR